MLIWADDPNAAPTDPDLLLWEGAPTRTGERSIVDIVERRGEEVRRRYLAWSHDFGELVVDGMPLREHFRFADGVDFWALSIFVEQSPWKQRSLEPILKLIALGMLLDEAPPAQLRFAGADAELGRVLAALCRKRGIRYVREPRPARRSPSRGFVRSLPHVLQGAAAILYFAATRRALRPPPAPSLDAPASKRVLLCGPFFNHELARDGSFSSRFWPSLPSMLQGAGFEVSWLHYFYAHEKVPNTDIARSVVDSINANAGSGGRHAFVDSWIDGPGLLRIARQWLHSARRSFAVGRSLQRRFAASPAQSYWPLLRQDWAKAFRGVGCVENLFFAQVFDRALQNLPRQDEGLYLMENQGWERALAQAWRKHGHGRLTGVVHSTIRFWDLRYHSDPRRYAAQRRLPGGEVVALNGRASREAYLSTVPQRESIADCEALRYLHLVQRDAGALRVTPAAEGTNGTRPTRVLVLGDYMRVGTEAVLALLQRAHAEFGLALEVQVKPHPNNAVDPRQFASLPLKLVSGSVADLLAGVDVVLCGNLTSASVDAYASGARVIVHDDGTGLNYSPLRGTTEVTFVRTSEQLRDAIRNAPPSRDARAFFDIDPALPGWRRHLGGA
jgi:surface carbohydrate biosynthesis protein (TIGR04326 family)